MISVKHEIASLLDRLPEDCSFEDVQYHLYVLEKIRRGVESAENGDVLSREEAEARLEQWLID